MNAKKRNQLIITSILACILIVAINNAAKRMREAKRLRIKHKVTVIEDGKVSEKRAFDGFSDTGLFEEKELATEGLYSRLEDETKDLALKRDPFFASSIESSGAAAISDVSLSGILWDEVAPLAIIDGDPIAIGDKIGQYTVKDIKKDNVILSDDSQTYELRLPQN